MIETTHAIVGATDPEAVVTLYRALGFDIRHRGTVPSSTARALYGLDGDTAEVIMAVPGSNRGWLRIVETPYRAEHAGPFDRGGHAIDLYTTDIERSVRVARAAGAACGPVVDYRVGPLHIFEAKAIGPDHLVTVFIQVERRRPSVLDGDPSRLHSEIHSVVWTVASADEALAFWRRAGLAVLLDVTVREPAVARLMDLPRPETPLRLAVMADATSAPLRFEVIEFPEDSGAERPAWPLRGGLHAVGCEVANLDGAGASLGVSLGETVAAVAGPGGGQARVAAALAPGGTRMELWEKA